jgi:hypothetical protein
LAPPLSYPLNILRYQDRIFDATEGAERRKLADAFTHCQDEQLTLEWLAIKS